MYHLSMEVSDYYSAAAAAKDHFIVEDLFNFNNVDVDPALDPSATDSPAFDAANAAGFAEPPAVGTVYGQHFPGPAADFPQPCEEVAELEWLSNFVEDCFSNKDYHRPLQFSNMSLNPSPSPSEKLASSNSAQSAAASNAGGGVPAKARSKRSRANPNNWASRLPVLNHRVPTPASSSSSETSGQKVAQQGLMVAEGGASGGGDGVRRCLHCGSDKTPQWRMGPMGPKTLCNACGVRYKSGRLVPEYRPAASPTFVVSEHSNSHRKVVELRRQKELQKQQQQRQVLFWS